MEEVEKIYLSRLTLDESPISFLFNKIPTLTIKSYQETIILKALDYYASLNREIPRNFFEKLEESEKEVGILRTIKKYEETINSIATINNIEPLELKLLIRGCFNPKEIPLVRSQNCRHLRMIIRKTISTSKEKAISDYITEEVTKFKKHCKVKKEEVKRTISKEAFADFILENESYYTMVSNYLKQIGYHKTDKKFIYEICCLVADENKDINDLANYFNIQKPAKYDDFIKLRAHRRLNNFKKDMNTRFAHLTTKEKEELLNYIDLKLRYLRINESPEEAKEYKINYTIEELKFLDILISVILDSGDTLSINDKGDFIFTSNTSITDEEIKEVKNYEKKLNEITKLNAYLYRIYNMQLKSLNMFAGINKNVFDDNNYEVLKEYYLSSEAINKLIEGINKEYLKNLDNNKLESLDNLLNNEGLLAAYLYGNMSKETLLLIINSFDFIYNNLNGKNITINNLNQIIRLAKVSKYVDDFSISIVGNEILNKIINYNQFASGEVTDEVIISRIKRVKDLAIRSERKKYSSLPFDCTVVVNDYKLQRYLNNDPTIFTSGVDTNTCFFVGVNENDFFFYSLLSKDGYVAKITDKNGKIIARLSCFRTNNTLMINGIRYVNNKHTTNNKDERIEFESIFELVRLFAYKLIEETSKDECPIDYVVCNKAGILESSIFDGRCETIDSILVNKPLNRYNDDWEEFIHTYDGKEQLLSEAPFTDYGFTTDFGGHFPALLIASRNNMGLLSPRDISINDQSATYKRPRRRPRIYLPQEFNQTILQRIRRIDALSLYNNTDNIDLELTKHYKMLNININELDFLILGDDWFILVNKRKEIVTRIANYSEETLEEIRNWLNNPEFEEEKKTF